MTASGFKSGFWFWGVPILRTIVSILGSILGSIHFGKLPYDNGFRDRILMMKVCAGDGSKPLQQTRPDKVVIGILKSSEKHS